MPSRTHQMVSGAFENAPWQLAALVIAIGMGIPGCGSSDPQLSECYAVRMAILSKDVQRVRTQLEGNKRVDVNCRKTDEAPTLLSYATNANSVDIAKLLLEEGANPDLADDGITPLMYASIHGYSDLAALLLEHGANINLVEGQYGMTALAYAVTRKHADLVRLLLANGADREHRLRNGSSIQQLALDRGGADVLRALDP